MSSVKSQIINILGSSAPGVSVATTQFYGCSKKAATDNKRWVHCVLGLPRWCRGKESIYRCRRCKRHGFDPWVWKIPWRRVWQPTSVLFFFFSTPVFLTGEFHGQRSLAGYSLWGHKESDTTEHPWMVLLSVLVAESCLTLCDSMDCRLPGSSVHGILHVRILEWVAISFSRGSTQPRDQTQVSHIAGILFVVWATREAPGTF